MRQYKIQFLPNGDDRTLSLLIDSRIVDDEVAYVPDKLVDCRGLALYIFATSEGLEWDNFQLRNEDDSDYMEEIEIDIIKRHYEYVFDPVYVRKAIRRQIRYT